MFNVRTAEAVVTCIHTVWGDLKKVPLTHAIAFDVERGDVKDGHWVGCGVIEINMCLSSENLNNSDHKLILL